MAAPITGPLDPTTGFNLGYIGDLETALQRRSALLTLLAAAPTGPFVTNENGRSVDFIAYRKSLMDEIKWLNEQIPLLAGPWQIRQRMG